MAHCSVVRSADHDSPQHSPFSPVEEIVADIRDGKMVIIMDDEDRENEGDLVMAAEMVRPDDINFMARFGRGLICLTLTQEHCQRLRLPLMVEGNGSVHGTNFTVSIEAAKGVTTGISAADRAATVRAAVARDARPEDLVQPGHIFPLMARRGGVLARAGHTEAGCDLAALAGLAPAAVIVEILNDDGTMARRRQLEAFGRVHGIKMGTVSDLIRYRRRTEKTVERLSGCRIPGKCNGFLLHAYRDVLTDELHYALVKGEIAPDQAVLTRVHVVDPVQDLLGTSCGDIGWRWPLQRALRRLANEKVAVAVILSVPEARESVLRRVETYAPRETAEGDESQDLRSYGVGAQILHDLGVRRMRVLGEPKRVHALEGFDLEIVDYDSSY